MSIAFPPTPEALQRAADRLIAALEAKADDEYRLAVLKRVARRFGETDYPLLLRLFTLVAEAGDDAAKRLVADTLAGALERADLPSGSLTSWGGSRLPQPGAGGLSVEMLSRGFFGATPNRRLGPIEYLTVWHFQRTQRTHLSKDAYAQALAQLVALLDHSERARRLYPAKLEADSQSDLEGAYTRATRDRLRAIAQAWRAGALPQAVAAAALGEPVGTTARPGWVVRDL